MDECRQERERVPGGWNPIRFAALGSNEHQPLHHFLLLRTLMDRQIRVLCASSSSSQLASVVFVGQYHHQLQLLLLLL
jgi:hypothetical protein